MPDAWEITYKDSGDPSIPGLNPCSDDANSDSDDDGWTNLQEYQAGESSPIVPYPSVPGFSSFSEGIFVGSTGDQQRAPDDWNLGNKYYPVKTLHAAVKRLNLLVPPPTPNVYQIKIASGTYTTNTSISVGVIEPDEPLSIENDVLLSGTGVVLDGSGAADWINSIDITDQAVSVILQGILIQNFSQAGVSIGGSGPVVNLSGAVIDNCETGVHVSGSQAQLTLGTVSNCNTYGISVAGSANVLSGGTVSACPAGIDVEAGGTGNTIQNIKIEGNTGDGILLAGDGNTVQSAVVEDNKGIGILVASDANTIDGVSLSHNGQAGMRVTGSENTWIGGSVSNSPIGIEIQGSKNNIGDGTTDSGGIISTCGTGIVLGATASENWIKNTLVQTNSVNGLLVAGNGNHMKDTRALSNGLTGINIIGPNNEWISGPVKNSETGIYISGTGNTIEGDPSSDNDDISGCDTGIKVAAGDNTIKNLQISGEIPDDSTGVAGIEVSMAVEASEKLILLNVTIRDFDVGMGVTTDAACIDLINSDISNCGTGLRLVESFQAIIDMGPYDAQSVISACNRGIEILEASSNNVIRNGWIQENIGEGIYFDGSREVPENNTIESMWVEGNAATGILFLAGFNNQVYNSVIVENNEDLNGDTTNAKGYGGVAVFNATAQLNWNHIQSNGCHDVYAEDALAGSPVDARYNWWGSPDGPVASKLSGPIDYKPWLGYADPWIGLPLQQDSDGDGLGDQWEEDQNQGLVSSDPGFLDPYDSDSDDDGIPDGQEPHEDGVTNLSEYQLDPLDEDDLPEINALYVGFGDTNNADDANAGTPRFPLKTVNAAVERVNALDLLPGDVFPIYLAAGDHFLNDASAAIHENLAIIGAGSNLTFVHGSGLIDDRTGNLAAAFQITAGPNRVIFERLTLGNTEVGIRASGEGGCIDLYDVVIEECGAGLQLVDSYQTSIDLGGSLIHWCENGVEILEGSSNNTIANGWVEYNTKDGILVQGYSQAPDGNVLEALEITSNGRNGVSFFAGTGNRVHNCWIEDNGALPPGPVEEPYSTVGGVVVYDAEASVNFSAIVDNHCWGVFAELDEGLSPVNAKYNWWGAKEGPSGAGPCDDTIYDCDTVSEDIVYTPWLGYEDPWIGLPEPSDSNDNGLGDEWENQYLWPTDDDGNPSNDPGDDPDQDGFTNLQEFQAFTHPLDPYSFPDNSTLFVGFEGAEEGNLGSPRFPISTLHETLHEAIAHVNAFGDSETQYKIYVAPGTYKVGDPLHGYEADAPLLISQNVHLYGDGLVTIDGTGALDWKSGFIITPGVTKLTMEGITIQNFKFGAGVQLSTDAACVEILDVDIYGCETGLHLVDTYQTIVDMTGSSITFSLAAGVEMCGGSFNNTIKNCVVSDSGEDGIAVLDGSGVIQYCKIENNTDTGIYVENAQFIDIAGSLIHGSARGIHLVSMDSASITSNTITGNAVNGVYVESGAANSALKALSNILYEAAYQDPNTVCTGTDCLDLFVEGDTNVLNYENFQYNNIGRTNLEWLPTTNLSVDPGFEADYSLSPSSICIDATDTTESGRDINGVPRPQGSKWDMGAFEAIVAFADTDSDGLPDAWETDFFGGLGVVNDPHDDYDGDGISNWEEYLSGTNPLSAISVAITDPAENPYYITDAMCNGSDCGDIPLAGTSTIAQSIFVLNESVVGGPGEAISGDLESWSVDGVPLILGDNFIKVTAEDEDGNTATVDLRVVTDDDVDPQVTILYPTNTGSYETTSDTITLKGVVSDNTGIDGLTCSSGDPVIVSGNNWTVSGVQLSPGSNTITVTATDMFNNQGSNTITITFTSEGAEYADQLSGGSQPGDPLDTNGNNWLDADEDICGAYPPATYPWNGELPLPGDMSNLNRYPEDYFDPTKIGYYWPDCLNPDDDGDGMPDGWESGNGLDPNDPSDASEDPDGDEFDNLSEYQNGTDPNTPDFPSFMITVHDPDTGAEITFDNWLPGFGKVLLIRAEWVGSSSRPNTVDFTLLQTSSYPGRAVNDPNPANMTSHHYPTWYYDAAGVDNYHGYDFGLSKTDPGEPDQAGNFAVHSFAQGATEVGQTGDYYEVYLQCWDYGARTKIRVTAANNPLNLGQKWIPNGSGENGIASAWDYDGIPGTPNIQHPNTLDPNADVDAIKIDSANYTAPKGDDFNNFEEYRGIVYTPTVMTSPTWQDLVHQRLNPFHKDLFIRGVGFTDLAGIYETDVLPTTGYPFRIGDAFLNADIDVYDISQWGHDATKEREFFVYYSEEGATVTIADETQVFGTGTSWSTSWPKHEWEFKLADDSNANWTPVRSWANSGQLYLDFPYPGGDTSASAAYKIRMPMPHINALIVKLDQQNWIPWQDGRIIYHYDSPPSQINPLGIRKWDWSTLAYAAINTTQDQGSMYGLAIALQVPIENYFYDRPYIDGNDNGWLDPISQSSGDEIKNNWKDNPADLTPFDIDGDTYVELPVASDPLDADPNGISLAEQDDDFRPYTVQRVLMHITTHEIAHALAGPLHTDDPNDLMYKLSNNWKRDGYLSDYYRSMLRIHNILR
jgi:hypothetical protein